MIFKCDSCLNSHSCTDKKRKKYQKLCKIAEKHQSGDCVRVKCNSYVPIKTPDKHREKTLIEEVITSCPFCGEMPKDRVYLNVENHEIVVALSCKCGINKSVAISVTPPTSAFALICAVYELVDDWNARTAIGLIDNLAKNGVSK